MKIAFFHELHKGGARKSVNETAKQLKSKHTVDLFLVGEKKEINEKEYFHSIFFFRFLPKKWIGQNWRIRFYKDTVELVKLFLLHIRIAKEINKKKYDVIFVHPSQFTQAPFILLFIRGIKIYYCHEPLRIVYDPLYKIKGISFEKHIYEKCIRAVRKIIDKINTLQATQILTNSYFTKKNIRSAYKVDSTVCYHGVDANFFKPINKKKDIDILFVGTEDSTEGGDIFKKVKKNYSGSHNIVNLNGFQKWISEVELRNYYQRSKIVLCLTRNEPFGMIPLEAGACGCVTIAIDEGGYKESIKDGFSGFLVKPDHTTIINKIDHLLSHPTEMKKMSQNACELMEKEWSWSKSSEKLEKIMISFVKNT